MKNANLTPGGTGIKAHNLGQVQGPAPRSEATPKAPPLATPDSVRTPLGEQANLTSTARDVSSQLDIRRRSSAAPKRRQGTRQKKLKTERVRELSRLEGPNFSPLVERVGQAVSAVRATVGSEAIQSLGGEALHDLVAAALEPHRDELFTSVRHAVRGPRSALTKAGIDAMVASGADALMFTILLQGDLRMPAVRAQMARIPSGIQKGEFTAAEAKKGLVTADGLLQRLALAGVPVDYTFQNNGPRDLLLSFASALHR